MKRGWWLAILSRAELADTAVTASRECRRVQEENALLRRKLRFTTQQRDEARELLQVFADTHPDARKAMGVYRTLRDIEDLPEVQK